LYYRKEGTLPLILILGGLAALGWATAIVLYVLGLCQAAARGDRALEPETRYDLPSWEEYQRIKRRSLDAANRRR
jgi:hypothetical protein